MTASPIDPILQTAADWFARLRDDADLDAWTDFQTWLEADPAHRLAYEDVEALWLDLEDPAAEALLATATATPSAPTDTKALEPRSTVTAFKPRSRRPLPWLIAGGAIAASIAILLLAPRWLPSAPTDYVTTKGEVRAVTLADGSRLTLGADTRVSVTMRAGHRDVILADGQAAFDVVHKPGSPFVVALGDQRVRVIGTEFNISRHEGRTAVTVRRGVVTVAQASGGEVRLTRGQQVLHTEGATVQEVRGADPDAVFAWRAGRLIYDNAPLADVVADFNRYGGAPIRIDPSAANVKVSGVFLVDRQQAMVERLAQFSGVVVVTRPNEIVLKGQ
jgi:transmembrane sensor